MSERTVHGLELTEYLRAPANGNVSLSFEDAVEAMKLAADEIDRLRKQLEIAMTALRRINSLAEKNVPKYAQEIAKRAAALGGRS